MRLHRFCAAASLALLAGCGSPPQEATDETSSAIALPPADSVWQPGFTPSAIALGRDIDWTPLYPCRAVLSVNGLLTPGKTRPDWNSCAVSYGGKVYSETNYQTLTPEWIPELGGAVPPNAFPVGSLNGETLYSCRATFGGILEVGKTGAGIAGCSIPFEGIELVVTSYEVLATPGAAFGLVVVPYAEVQPDLAQAPISAGNDASGQPLYPCVSSYEGLTGLLGQMQHNGLYTTYCEVASNGRALAAGTGFSVIVPWQQSPSSDTFVAGQDTGGGALGICTTGGPYSSYQVGKYIPSSGLCDFAYGPSEMASTEFEVFEAWTPRE